MGLVRRMRAGFRGAGVTRIRPHPGARTLARGQITDADSADVPTKPRFPVPEIDPVAERATASKVARSPARVDRAVLRAVLEGLRNL